VPLTLSSARMSRALSLLTIRRLAVSRFRLGHGQGRHRGAWTRGNSVLRPDGRRARRDLSMPCRPLPSTPHRRIVSAQPPRSRSRARHCQARSGRFSAQGFEPVGPLIAEKEILIVAKYVAYAFADAVRHFRAPIMLKRSRRGVAYFFRRVCLVVGAFASFFQPRGIFRLLWGPSLIATSNVLTRVRLKSAFLRPSLCSRNVVSPRRNSRVCAQHN